MTHFLVEKDEAFKEHCGLHSTNMLLSTSPSSKFLTQVMMTLFSESILISLSQLWQYICLTNDS